MSEAPKLPDSLRKLGHRELDASYTWKMEQSFETYYKSTKVNVLKLFIKDLRSKRENKKREAVDPEVIVGFKLDGNKPTQSQQIVISMLESFFSKTEKQQVDDPLVLLVGGISGSGKSTLIRYMKHRLERLNIKHYITSYTGSSSSLISGCTLSSLFGMKKDGISYETMLKDDRIDNHLRNKFVDCQVLIIDEYSFLGGNFWNYMDQSLKRIFDTTRDYGGLSLVVLGDFCQSLPIEDFPLHSCPKQLRNQGHEFAAKGIETFQRITNCVWLHENVRQKQDGAFFRLLNNIRDKEVTHNDFEILKTRFKENLRPFEQNRFKNAVVLFPFRWQADFHNRMILENLEIPLAKIPHLISPSEGYECTFLPSHQQVFLAKDVKVMLIKNVLTDRHLINGAMGVVEDVIYAENNQPPHHLPEVVMVRIDTFKGQTPWGNGKAIPIVPIQERVYVIEENKYYTITSIPLINAFALTHLKTQGMNLEFAKICLSGNETHYNMTYVCLSRVKKLDHIMIIPNYFDFERFKQSKFLAYKCEQQKESRRLGVPTRSTSCGNFSNMLDNDRQLFGSTGKRARLDCTLCIEQEVGQEVGQEVDFSNNEHERNVIEVETSQNTNDCHDHGTLPSMSNELSRMNVVNAVITENTLEHNVDCELDELLEHL